MEGLSAASPGKTILRIFIPGVPGVLAVQDHIRFVLDALNT
jgi:hypothetical protein